MKFISSENEKKKRMRFSSLGIVNNVGFDDEKERKNKIETKHSSFFLFRMNSSDIIEPKLHCYLYRFAGFLILLASVINLLVMVRYFIQRCFGVKNRFLNRLSPIINGMFISSILVIITGIPLVVFQCFRCRPLLAYELLCHIHGFMCLATGLFNM